MFGKIITGCQLLKPVDKHRYLKSGIDLVDLNNELAVNPYYKNRVQNLELFLNISFKCDEMLHPYNTGNFA